MKKIALLFSSIFLITTFITAQPISVLTQRYSNKRLGWNNRETILNATNISPANFGLLFKRTVDDQIYAQPLYIQDMFINGSIHNVVFVATVNNSVYAFDADDSASMAPLWQVNLNPSGSRAILNTDMTGACGGGYLDFSGHMGIVGTPVIDTTTNTIYLVTRTVTTTSHVYSQHLHALDIATGLDKPGSPVYITATVPGTGAGSNGVTITFNQQKQNQRAALLLHNGVVYICWAAHCDWTPYHGWMLGYDAATLNQVCVYNDTPDGYDGGIWMSAGGPTVDDSGYVYITTGNGTVGDGGSNPNYYKNRGESLLKLKPVGDSMQVVNFFTPANYAYLEANDLDYGVDAPLIIPNSNRTLSGSKEGIMYLVDNNRMGGCTPGNDSVLQVVVANAQTVFDKHLHGSPVYYHYYSQTDTECVYVWAESDSLKQFFYNRTTGLFDFGLTITGNVLLSYGMPGGMLAVSSDSAVVGTGVVWASHPRSGNANQQVRPGRLDAYDARDIRRLLWTSDMLINRDSIGRFSKFNTPVVANGKMYMATFSNRLNVYGLLPTFTNVIDKNDAGLFVNLYPNPTDKKFTLNYSLQNEADDFKLVVVDLLGRPVMTQQLSSHAGAYMQELELPAQLSAGVYEATFYSKQHLISVVKLVKY